MAKTRQTLFSQCLTCIMDRNLEKMPKDATEEQRIKYIQGITKLIADATEDTCATVVSRDIYNLHNELFGAPDHTANKRHFNSMIMAIADDVEKTIRSSEDPVKTAIQYAMVANYIDFAALSHVDEDYLKAALAKATDYPVNPENYEKFRKDLETGKKLAYLTDNCGEIVVDKILIRLIHELYPDIDVTVIVKGGIVQGDANMDDADMVGMQEVATVIDNGNDIAGTWLPDVSEAARKVIDDADIIISKGQANYETMWELGYNVYYILLAKCDMVAKRFGVERLTGLFAKE